MIIIYGEGKSVRNKLVVADSDALIALTLEEDIHHKKAKFISNILLKNGVTIIFPVTVFPETITFLKRAVNQPDRAHTLNRQLTEGNFSIEYVNEDILTLAAQYFEKAKSKKNTFFDSIVAATAKTLEADAIFSFDEWYKKLGFKLASDLS